MSGSAHACLIRLFVCTCICFHNLCCVNMYVCLCICSVTVAPFRSSLCNKTTALQCCRVDNQEPSNEQKQCLSRTTTKPPWGHKAPKHPNWEAATPIGDESNSGRFKFSFWLVYLYSFLKSWQLIHDIFHLCLFLCVSCLQLSKFHNCILGYNWLKMCLSA